jgi:hypothetical protein
MMFSGLPTIAIALIALIVHALVIYVLRIRSSIKAFREKQPHGIPQFSITEIWAAIIGLTPTFLLLAVLFESRIISNESWILRAYLVAFCALSQILGIINRKLVAVVTAGPFSNSTWYAVTAVIVGALEGLVYMLLLPMMILLIFNPGFALPFLAVGYVLYQIVRVRRPK